MSACKYVLGLTGTLLNGYAESIRPLLFRLCPESIVREGFEWGNPMPFSERYGRIETRITTRDTHAGDVNVMSRGRSGGRSVTRCIRPGIVPSLLKHLIQNTVFLSLEDVADHLPPLDETLVPVDLDKELEGHYRSMEKALTNAVKQAFSKGAKKMLGPMLNALMHWPDHPCGWPDLGYTDEHGGFTCVHRPYNFPESMPAWNKEQALLDLVKKERAEGRQCWVYVQLTDKHDVAARLQTLLEAQGLRVALMRATVEPAKREAWIQQHAKGADVVLSHPKLVETGLDLFDKRGNHNFATLVFYETGTNLFTMRQASRRSWRIGQHLPCRVFYLYYASTMQERMLTLMGRKLMAAEALEGKFSSEGLAAMVGEDESMELALAKSLAEQASDLDARAAWQQPIIPAAPAAKPVSLAARMRALIAAKAFGRMAS
jgi:hypothetical protein